MPTAPDIAAYVATLPPAQQDLAALLLKEFATALPRASSKVWHGHPVWFDGENPVVGFDGRKAGLHVLFWNGQALAEPGLVAVGKYRAAGTHYAAVADVKVPVLRRWLRQAGQDVFDGVTYFRQLRETAKQRAAVEKAKGVVLAKTPASKAPGAAKRRPATRAAKAPAKSRTGNKRRS